LTPSNATSLHPDKTSRAGEEMARQRGVSVLALLVPITTTRFSDRKEGNAFVALW